MINRHLKPQTSFKVPSQISLIAYRGKEAMPIPIIRGSIHMVQYHAHAIDSHGETMLEWNAKMRGKQSRKILSLGKH